MRLDQWICSWGALFSVEKVGGGSLTGELNVAMGVRQMAVYSGLVWTKLKVYTVCFRLLGRTILGRKGVILDKAGSLIKLFKRLCRFNLQRKVLSIFQVTEPDPISVRSVQGG